MAQNKSVCTGIGKTSRKIMGKKRRLETFGPLICKNGEWCYKQKSYLLQIMN
jgi:hypothetical protein